MQLLSHLKACYSDYKNNLVKEGLSKNLEELIAVII